MEPATVYHLPSLSVQCQPLLLRQTLTKALTDQGCLVLPHARGEVNIIVDSPVSEALASLERRGADRQLVLTENPCGEYWLDLLQLGLRGLIVHCSSVDSLIFAAATIARGRTFIRHPAFTSPLVPQERRVLQLLAGGVEVDEISERLQIKESVVRNYIYSLLNKLRGAHPQAKFGGRTQLANYYWGNWSLVFGLNRSHTEHLIR